MRFPEGEYEIEYGTLPTPDDPMPSNQVRHMYPTGEFTISTPPPTEEVLAEYVAAIAQWPDDSGLHLHYAISLRSGGRYEEAMREAQTALRLNPSDAFTNGFLGDLHKQAGDLDASIAQLREQLRLANLHATPYDVQGRTIAQWSLAEALLERGERAEARQLLQGAVAAQREGVRVSAASPQLLAQLEDKLAELPPED